MFEIKTKKNIRNETERIIEQLDCMVCHFLSIVEDNNIESAEYGNAVKHLFRIVDIVNELTGEELDAAKMVRRIDLERAYARYGGKEQYEQHIEKLIQKMTGEN